MLAARAGTRRIVLLTDTPRPATHDIDATVEYSRVGAPAENVAIAHLEEGTFSPGDPGRYRHLADILRHHDYFLVCSDFATYHAKGLEVDEVFRDRSRWIEMAARNTARSGWFSSDRTIGGYAREIWGADAVAAPVRREGCVLVS